MNIAQELSIVRDNIAEYGMTNITQFEYDAIYQQGRADATKEIKSVIKDTFDIAYAKGKANAIDEVIKSLEAQFLMQNNPSSKFVETIVLHRDFIDALEQLKDQK